MKNLRTKMYLLIILLILTSCANNSTKSKEDDVFAIYFLADDNISYDQAIEIGMKNLGLESEAFINSDDIDYYDPESDRLYLNHDLQIKGYDSTMDFFMSAAVIPYVLIIDEKRFFIGSIIGMASSRMYAGPILGFANFNDNNNTFIYFDFGDLFEHYKIDSKFQNVLNNFII